MTKVEMYNPWKVIRIFRSILNKEDSFDQDREHLWVVGLTDSQRIIYAEAIGENEWLENDSDLI